MTFARTVSVSTFVIERATCTVCFNIYTTYVFSTRGAIHCSTTVRLAYRDVRIFAAPPPPLQKKKKKKNLNVRHTRAYVQNASVMFDSKLALASNADVRS